MKFTANKIGRKITSPKWPFGFGILLCFALTLSICVIGFQFYTNNKQLKEKEQISKPAEEVQSLDDPKLEKWFFEKMENRYNNFTDNVTIFLTILSILVMVTGILIPLFTLYNFSTGRIKELNKTIDEGIGQIREMETSLLEKIQIIESYNSPNPNMYRPHSTTKEARAFIFYMEALREFRLADNHNSPTDKEKMPHIHLAMSELDESIRLSPDPKAYQLRASCYMALAEKNDAEMLKYHKKAYDDIAKGLKLSPDDPNLLYSHAENFMTAYENGVHENILLYIKDEKVFMAYLNRLRPDSCLEKFFSIALGIITAAINKNDTNAYYFWVRATLIYQWMEKTHKKRKGNISFQTAINDINTALKLPYNDVAIKGKLENLKRKIYGILNEIEQGIP